MVKKEEESEVEVMEEVKEGMGEISTANIGKLTVELVEKNGYERIVLGVVDKKKE